MASELVTGVTVDPSVAFGKPVIAGTRTPAVVILTQLAAGVPEEALCDEGLLLGVGRRCTTLVLAPLALRAQGCSSASGVAAREGPTASSFRD